MKTMRGVFSAALVALAGLRASDSPRYELRVGHGRLHIELVYAADGRRLRARRLTE